MNNYWNSLIKRIQSESYRQNGKTTDAVSQVSVKIVLHDGNPIMWEVVGANKIEPSCDLTESVGSVSHYIRQLSELCQTPEQVSKTMESFIAGLKSN